MLIIQCKLITPTAGERRGRDHNEPLRHDSQDEEEEGEGEGEGEENEEEEKEEEETGLISMNIRCCID